MGMEEEKGMEDDMRIHHLQERVSHLLLELRERNADKEAWIDERRQLEARNRELVVQLKGADCRADDGRGPHHTVVDKEDEILLARLRMVLETSRRSPEHPRASKEERPRIPESDMTDRVCDLLKRAEIAARERDDAMQSLGVERQALSDAIQQLAVTKGELRELQQQQAEWKRASESWTNEKLRASLSQDQFHRTHAPAQEAAGHFTRQDIQRVDELEALLLEAHRQRDHFGEVVRGLQIELQDGKYREQVMAEEAEEGRRALMEVQAQANYWREDAEGMRVALGDALEHSARSETHCEKMALDLQQCMVQHHSLEQEAQMLRESLKAVDPSSASGVTTPGTKSVQDQASSGLKDVDTEKRRSDGMVEALADVQAIVRTAGFEFSSLSSFARRLAKMLDPDPGQGAMLGARAVDNEKSKIEARALEASSRSLQTLMDEIRVAIDFTVHRGLTETPQGTAP